MGATWCRERIEQAQNSKSHVDRIIVRCSNVIYPKYAKTNHAKLTKDIVFKPTRTYRAPQYIPKKTIPKIESEWTNAPIQKQPSFRLKTPVPPPRKKRKRKCNTLELLTNHLEKMCEETKDEPKGSTIETDLENNEVRHKNRARKIMENKTRFVKKENKRPLSLSIMEHNIDIDTKLSIPKTISSTSLPNYLELCRHFNDESIKNNIDNKAPLRNVSTGSLPGESLLTALSQVTKQRIESYVKKCRNFGSQPLIQTPENQFPSESEDSWSGLDDWDLGVIEHCAPEVSSTLKKRDVLFSVGPPVTPKRHQKNARQLQTPPLLSDKLKLWVKTPPPTPNELSENEPIEMNTHFQLIEALNKCQEKRDKENLTPSPPSRKVRKVDIRRQSVLAPKENKSTGWIRSVSMDGVEETPWSEDQKTNLRRSWENLDMRRTSSLQQALREFLSSGDTSALTSEGKLSEGNQDKEVEANLNSSLFPVIGIAEKGEKATLDEEDDDRSGRSPPPPPLPLSPPPTTISNSIFPTVSFQ